MSELFVAQAGVAGDDRGREASNAREGADSDISSDKGLANADGAMSNVSKEGYVKCVLSRDLY